MEIRPATKDDLTRIMELGKEFGHLMLYQKDPMMMEQYLDRILVAREYLLGAPGHWKVVGYYHYIVSGDPGFEEMLRCYRQFPDWLIIETQMYEPFSTYQNRGELCVCMQGASHREAFREFILSLQVRYPNIWNYCSIKSRRVETYKALGFTYDPNEQYTFFNVSKGDTSTYQLGRWKK